MKLGMVGVGRMGGNMALRLLGGGHEVVAFDVSADAVDQARRNGAVGVSALQELAAALERPRVVWLMVPAGDITQNTMTELAQLLDAGDVIVDGGNSRYTDTIRRAGALAANGITLVDAGTSGGIWGLEAGYCLMVGGEEPVVARLEPIFETLAPEGGYLRVGGPGAGHFVKMIHNGIEYGLMQAYGEGFELLASSEFDLDVAQIAELWRHGSVVRSWLLDLAARALEADPKLETLSDYVEDSGEARWALETAIARAVPTPTIATALFNRFASRQDESFANKLIAALRREFGGHGVRGKEEQ